jgi:hypothetical protein
MMPALTRTRSRLAALALPLAALASPVLAKPARPAPPAAAAPAPAQACITEREVVEAQKAWGEGIIAIGKTYREGGDYTAAAAAHINRFYGYDLSLVLFKPTLAAIDQFRTSFDAALSYFVAGNPSFPEDKGFAIKPWSKVRWKNYGIVNNSCTMAVAMGNYWFTPADGGADTKVEYSFAYVRDAKGDLKIVVHHSSVPFNPR